MCIVRVIQFIDLIGMLPSRVRRFAKKADESAERLFPFPFLSPLAYKVRTVNKTHSVPVSK